MAMDSRAKHNMDFASKAWGKASSRYQRQATSNKAMDVASKAMDVASKA